MCSTIDTHVEGKAFRIVMQSPISPNKKDIQANHAYVQTHFEYEKNLLLNEPRGHRDMRGCIVIPSKVADIGVLFFNHDGQVNFTYSGLIAVITALLETGNIPEHANGLYTIETAYGVYIVQVTVKGSEVRSVYVESQEVTHEHVAGETVITVDGDRRYVLYPLPKTIPAIDVQHLLQLNHWGRNICLRMKDEGVGFDGVVLVEEKSSSDTTVRSITFEKDGNILRSPGVDSSIALLASKQALHPSVKELTNESIFNSRLTVKAIPETKRYSVEAEAFITGLQDFIYDEDDPLKDGFLLK